MMIARGKFAAPKNPTAKYGTMHMKMDTHTIEYIVFVCFRMCHVLRSSERSSSSSWDIRRQDLGNMGMFSLSSEQIWVTCRWHWNAKIMTGRVIRVFRSVSMSTCPSGRCQSRSSRPPILFQTTTAAKKMPERGQMMLTLESDAMERLRLRGSTNSVETIGTITFWLHQREPCGKYRPASVLYESRTMMR